MLKQTLGIKWCTATIEDIVERNGKNGLYLLWSFKDSNGNRCIGFTDATLKMGGRFWTWLYCLGFPMSEGGNCDTDLLKGKSCTILLGGKNETVSMVVSEGLTPSSTVMMNTQTTQTVEVRSTPETDSGINQTAADLFG